MVLTEIILDSFVLFATILLIIMAISYVFFKVKGKKKIKTHLRKTFVKIGDDEVHSTNQFVNVQLADNNNHNMNYYSYQNALNNNGNEIEINNLPPQFNSKQDTESARLKRKHYHFHKTTNSISKISYR